MLWTESRICTLSTLCVMRDLCVLETDLENCWFSRCQKESGCWDLENSPVASEIIWVLVSFLASTWRGGESQEGVLSVQKRNERQTRWWRSSPLQSQLYLCRGGEWNKQCERERPGQSQQIRNGNPGWCKVAQSTGAIHGKVRWLALSTHALAQHLMTWLLLPVHAPPFRPVPILQLTPKMAFIYCRLLRIALTLKKMRNHWKENTRTCLRCFQSYSSFSPDFGLLNSTLWGVTHELLLLFSR